MIDFSRLSGTALVVVLVVYLVIDLIHNVAEGFDGIAYRWFKNDYDTIENTLRRNKPLFLMVRWVKRISDRLNVFWIVFAVVLSVILVRSPNPSSTLVAISWVAILTQGGYIAFLLIRHGFRIVKAIVSSWLTVFWKRKFKKTRRRTMFMPRHIPQSVAQEESSVAPEELDVRSFFRGMTVNDIATRILYAIDMWGTWRYHLGISLRRAGLAVVRGALVILVILNLLGLPL